MLSKVCCSIGSDVLKTLDRLIEERVVSLAELRLDLLLARDGKLNFRRIRRRTKGSMELIATYMSESFVSEECSSGIKDILLKAIDAKFDYVDVGVFALFRDEVVSYAKKKGVKVIVSYHGNFSKSIYGESDIYDMCIEAGADIVKIVATGGGGWDSVEVLGLYEKNIVPLIAFATGKEARISRIASLFYGAPFGYASVDADSETASGQFTYLEMDKLLRSIQPKIEGAITIPSSKSIAQRAILFAALAEGESRLSNFYPSKDVNYAIEVARQLEADVIISRNELIIKGTAGLKKPKHCGEQAMWQEDMVIFVGESGLLSRMMIPLAAQIGCRIEIIGEGTLLGRPMEGCKDVVERLGGMALLSANDTLPAIIKGPLMASDISVSGESGSQLISGLLSSLPLSKGASRLTVVNPTSIPYIRMTYEILQSFGIEIERTILEDKLIYDIPGGQKYKSADIRIDGDWSSATYFMVAAAIFGEVEVLGMGNMTVLDLDGESVQADKSILSILDRCGASVEKIEDGYKVTRSMLRSFKYDATHTPDLFPILAVLALFCEGKSEISGVHRLMNKESNRAESIRDEFKKLKIDIEIDGDVMIIEGMSLARRVAEGKMPPGGNLSTHNDHRIAMALSVLSLATTDETILDDISCIDKSFPSFIKRFNQLRI